MPYIYDNETGEHQDVTPERGRVLVEAGTHTWNPRSLTGDAGRVAQAHEGELMREHNERVQMQRLHEARMHQRYLASLSPEERARQQRFERMASEAHRFAGGGRRNVS